MTNTQTNLEHAVEELRAHIERGCNFHWAAARVSRETGIPYPSLVVAYTGEQIPLPEIFNARGVRVR